MDTIWWTNFCGNETEYDAFWSPNISTYTSNPDLTRCFQDTLLVWVPIGVLVLCQPFYITYLRRRKTVKRCYNKGALQWIKLALALVLLCLAVVNAVIAISTHEQLSSTVGGVLRCIAMLITAILTHYEFAKGVHSSALLTMFLMVETVCSIFRARSVMMQYQLMQPTPSQDVQFVLLAIYAALITVLFLLNVPSDTRALSRDDTVPTEQTPLLQVQDGLKKQAQYPNEPKPRISPEISASFLNKITFAWYTSLVIKGNKKYLEFEDLYDILDREKCDTLVPKFLETWNKKCEQYRKRLLEKQMIDNELKLSGTHIYPESDPYMNTVKLPKPPSLLGAIFISIGRIYWWSTIIRAVAIGLVFINPYILTQLLGYLEKDDMHLWKGIVLCVGLGLSDLLHITVFTSSLHFGYTFGIQARAVVTAAIYRKVLRLSSASKKGTTTGQILNLMSVDAQRIQDCPVFWNNVWALPPTIIVATIFLFQVTGYAALVGVAVLIVLIIPINGIYVSNKIRDLQVTQMFFKDKRLRLLGEILNGIKVLKLYAWEKSFLKSVLQIREDELDYMKKSNIYSAVSSMTWNCTTYLVTFVIFGIHIVIEENAVLTARKVFVTSSLVGILNISLSMLPMGVSYIGQTWVALERITEFLLLDEIDPDTVTVDPEAVAAITINSGTFSWDKENSPILRDIDIHIPVGKLVAVVGKVGSGKSSLISAILGDTWKVSGDVSVKGDIAYVPQIAWIQNKNVRDNITFSKSYRNSWYTDVVRACALETDFTILVDGDKTEIGEKGINLSGGQKQRVSVARAVYQDADIYLLDDPLSAVDAHVGKHLFEQVIGPKGVLKNKTRLLITHSLTHLPGVDYIIVMEAGEIVDVGTYQELLDRDGAFSNLLRSVNGLSASSNSETDVSKTEKKPIARLSSVKSQNISLKRRASRLSSKRSTHSMEESTSTTHTHTTDARPVQKLIEEEVAQEGNLQLSVIRAYVVAGGLGIMVLTICFHLLYGVSLVAGSIWLSKWTDDAVPYGNVTRAQNLYRLGVYGGIVCGQAIVNLIGSLAIALGSVCASRILHHDMVDRILHAPMMFFDTTPLGRVINRLSRDMDTVDFNVPMFLRQWFFTVVPLLSTVIIISYVTPIFLAAVVPLTVFYTIVMRGFVKIMRQLRRIDSIKRSPLFAHFDESLSGTSSVRAYKQQKRFIQKCDDLTDDSQRAWYLFLTGQRWLSLFLELIGMMVIILASILTVIQRDTVSAGEAGMSVSFSLLIYIYLTFYVRSSAELETYMVAVERIKEYTEITSEAAWDIDATRPVIGWPREGHVHYDAYSTRYRPGLDLVLKDINCDIKQGEKVGVVGRTGAGKSSIALSLFRIIESTAGHIWIDGVDISTLGLYALRSRLTIIPQDPVIFSGSIRMNLDPLDEHTDEEIWSSLELSHLREFVNRLQEGLSYECGEGGEALCIGQRQLLCLARALLRRSRVLVLDEATAAIDLETDELIQNTIRTAFQECTILTIAHRINTILDYDKVIVMDAGRVVEFESPVTLLQNQQSVFYGMAKSAGIVQ